MSDVINTISDIPNVQILQMITGKYLLQTVGDTIYKWYTYYFTYVFIYLIIPFKWKYINEELSYVRYRP